MIQTLVNPKTELYYNFKNIIFSNNFPWFWQTTSTGELFLEGHTDVSFYGHSLLCRPDELVNQRYTRPLSEHLETFTQIVDEIFERRLAGTAIVRHKTRQHIGRQAHQFQGQIGHQEIA